MSSFCIRASHPDHLHVVCIIVSATAAFPSTWPNISRLQCCKNRRSAKNVLFRAVDLKLWNVPIYKNLLQWKDSVSSRYLRAKITMHLHSIRSVYYRHLSWLRKRHLPSQAPKPCDSKQRRYGRKLVIWGAGCLLNSRQHRHVGWITRDSLAPLSLVSFFLLLISIIC